MKFTKMHGIGNDYVYLDCIRDKTPANLPELSVLLSRQHTGIGADGLIVIERGSEADFRMIMFNADGSEGKMCGNGIRCVGKFVFEHGYTDKTSISVETASGIKYLELNTNGTTVRSVRVDMGRPRLRPEEIPVVADGQTVIGLPLPSSEGILEFTCISMGNPHAVAFVERMPNLAVVGLEIEYNIVFPERANVSFVQVESPRRLRMRVWERGSGETQACGTGACAVLVAAVLNGLAERKATVVLNGGELEIEWDETSGHVYMTGTATTAFEGEWINT